MQHRSLVGVMIILVFGLFGWLFPSVASAALVWGTDASAYLTGSRTSLSLSGITATDGWDNGGMQLGWEVTQDPSTKIWTYQYTVLTPPKAVSHFILEVTNDGKPFAILPGSDVDSTDLGTWSLSNGNPLMPNPIYGVKFDFGGETSIYTIVTDRAPVWGVFYAKDGHVKEDGEKVDVVAWSNALNYETYKTNTGLSLTDYIVRPDSAPVPLPAAFWLLGSGLIGLVMVRRRMKK